MNEKYYRYTEMLFTESRVNLLLREYDVEKHTKKGVWLLLPYGMGRRFVLNGTRKKFACPTKEEALISFRARKKRQIQIYKARLRIVEQALMLEPND